MTQKDWKRKLTREQYEVLINKGTEAPFSGELLDNFDDGIYKCVACENKLFSSRNKYKSNTPGLMGWPSFREAISNGAVKLKPDNSLGIQRTEVVCAKCGGHLGHLFDDELSDNGKHYCINSVCLSFDFDDKKS